MNLEMDPNLLLSLINTKLRNNYKSLKTLCEEEGLDEALLKEKLLSIDYEYNQNSNQFKPKE